MPRRVSPNVAGGIYHVTTRGNRRETIFFDDFDYAAFLRQLAKTIERFGWLCHSYCLIPNHYHLLVQTPEPNLAGGMLVLNGAYARRSNVRYARDGHVFQGPYRCEPVQRDAHFLETCRYIALNPVRAGLCADPAEWPWSSYRALAGLERRPPWLHVDFVRAMFASPTRPATRCFREFVAAGAMAPNRS